MNEKGINKVIVAISIAVPLLVAILYFTPAIHITSNLALISMLPKFHALLNSMVAVLLVFGLYFIKRKNKIAHKLCMIAAFSCSTLFLLSYVVYHSAAVSTKFGGEGFIKSLYYFILISHIVLAAVILPFILITLSRALTNKFDQHKKIARITWPLWLYVSITGVIVYFMISPYYI